MLENDHRRALFICTHITIETVRLNQGRWREQSLPLALLFNFEFCRHPIIGKSSFLPPLPHFFFFVYIQRRRWVGGSRRLIWNPSWSISFQRKFQCAQFSSRVRYTSLSSSNWLAHHFQLNWNLARLCPTPEPHPTLSAPALLLPSSFQKFEKKGEKKAFESHLVSGSIFLELHTRYTPTFGEEEKKKCWAERWQRAGAPARRHLTLFFQDSSSSRHKISSSFIIRRRKSALQLAGIFFSAIFIIC